MPMEAKIRLFLLTALTMVAFAANSILNRLALADGDIGPAGFAALRVASGVVVLWFLLVARRKGLPSPRQFDWKAVCGLTAYMLGFSFAYVSMDAGLGALILFGVVQITMFFGVLLEGERPALRKWIGMIVSMAGLAILTTPSGPVHLGVSAVALMVVGAIGWGIYSLAGRKVSDPLGATGVNFLLCLPLVAVVLLAVPDGISPSAEGIVLALMSGGVTSALGYALWYSLLPSLGATRGALAQLSAPAIAIGLGAVLLGEVVTAAGLLAAALILGGIAIGLVKFP